jgi:REP element-mobilizing transposase RayT
MERDKPEHYQIGFYTATIYQWKYLLNADEYKSIIVESLRFLVDNNRATIYAFVIMPNHIHLLWRINSSWNLTRVQADFMKFTAQKIKFDLIENHPAELQRYYVGLKDRDYQFWQRNSLNSYCESRKVVEQKLAYIHNNPCQGKWMLTNNPMDYKFSSVRFYETDGKEYEFLTHYMEFFE